MLIADEARATQDRAIRRSDRAANAAMAKWRRVDPAALDQSWAAVSGDIAIVAASTARANAVGAATLTSKIAVSDDMTGDVLVPDSFTGVDGSGRSLSSLLDGAITTTKQAIAAGMSIPDAMLTGGTYLALMVKTSLADVERSASMTAATGKGYVRYVRLVNPGACSRCAILAGADRFRSNFRRHPACRCSTVPVVDATPNGLFDTPGDYFDSLSTAEQDRVFTKAGAESIRLGADPIKVVNARRGANRARMDGAVTFNPSRIQPKVIGRKPDGAPINGYVTTEGSTKRGTYGRSRAGLNGRTPRLMPESIIDLTDDPEMRRILLRDAGYLESPIRNLGDNRWISERATQQARDHAAAIDFYRSQGIFVG
ncbi:hypothetical protein ACIP5T_03125 [Microbacterium sp. NPDC088619]|uniref:hypothetical protein n=1 Tax=Microbacterium sp. NPDC088619 TaxID=3364196 RepID=UPI00380E1896